MPFVLKNNTRETEGSHFLRFRFYKTPAATDELYNTVVKLTGASGKIQLQRYNPQRGFISSMEHVLHFGTGTETVIPKVEIIFPSQKKIVLENVTADQVLTVYETDAKQLQTPEAIKPTLFTDITPQNKFKFIQTENDYIDFKREPLIPYKCSRKGPYYASADVNGDGKEDMYIGGAAGTPGTLMIQNPDGSFAEKKLPAIAADKAYEDMGALFFDADGDKDNDLYVVSGGAEFDAGSNLYQDRLYINDGKGNFTKAAKAVPAEGFNGSCITALDYDEDGDLDLFVGGHVLPGKFPQADKCMLLQNNKGVFTDVTATAGAALLNAGIVNCASWTDMDGDGKNELTISGEWMPVTVFKIQNGVFGKQETTVSFTSPVTKKDTSISMSGFTGWWYCIKTADIDNDGDLDIILGNRGTNATIKGNYYNPCTVYAKDFDGNGSYDAVLGYYIQGQCYPLFSRDQLIDQMPAMRKKFIRYKDYSGTTLDKLFSPEQQKGMDIYKTRFFESGVLINDGSGRFRFVPFPEKAQLANVSDFAIADFDKDGFKDLVVCGNSNDAAVMVGNYDAMASLLLKGDGKGGFEAMPHTTDGFKVRGECRKLVYMAESRRLIFLKNSGTAQIYQHN
jgi:enediyne biosynthesis protein E4